MHSYKIFLWYLVLILSFADLQAMQELQGININEIVRKAQQHHAGNVKNIAQAIKKKIVINTHKSQLIKIQQKNMREIIRIKKNSQRSLRLPLWHTA